VVFLVITLFKFIVGDHHAIAEITWAVTGLTVIVAVAG
jgi:hypothetical protein